MANYGFAGEQADFMLKSQACEEVVLAAQELLCGCPGELCKQVAL